MFLPPAVTMMSFLRSVILTKPSSSICRDVAGAEPAVGVEHLRRRLGVLVVAGEDGLAADQELAVVGDPQLEARAAAGPTVPNRQRSGRVRRRRRRALGQAVALEDPDPDRVEELGDLLDERRAARDRRPQAPAEPLADLREDEPVGDAVLQRSSADRHGRPWPAAAAHAPPDAERPVGEPALDAGRLVDRRRRRRCGSSRRRAGRSGAPSVAPSGSAAAVCSGSGRNAIA